MQPLLRRYITNRYKRYIYPAIIKELSENTRGFAPLNLVGPGRELTSWVKGYSLKGKDESYYLLEMIKSSNKGNGERHDNIFRYFLDFAYKAINSYTNNL